MYIPFIVGTALFHKKDFLIKRSLLICLFTGIIFFIMYFNWNSEMASMPLLRLHQYINPASWNLLEYPFLCYIYQIIMGLTGSIFVISLFIKLSQVLPESKIGNILAYWGTLTLGIYVWQAVLLEHIMMKTINLANIDYITFNYIISPIISVVVLIVCVALTKALKANKWSAFLFLGSKSTK